MHHVQKNTRVYRQNKFKRCDLSGYFNIQGYFNYCQFNLSWGFPGGSVGKESACNAGDWVQSLGQKDPLQKEMAFHSWHSIPAILPGIPGKNTNSSIFAWKIPWTEKPGGHMNRLKQQSLCDEKIDEKKNTMTFYD